MSLLLLVLSLALLLYSGGRLTVLLTRLSQTLQTSSFLIGFLLMAACTTVPEFSVALMSALQGTPEVALGTAIGSNVCNIALVMGILLTIHGRFSLKGVLKTGPALWAAGIGLLPLVMVVRGGVSRLEGVVLLAAFVGYLIYLLRVSGLAHKVAAASSERHFWRDLGLFLVTVAVLLVSAHFTVVFAQQAAEAAGVPVSLIAILLLALGTSLPEFVFGIRAAMAGDPTAAVGDITGAVVFNASLIIGMTTVVRPILTAELSEYLLPAGALSLLLIYLVVATITDRVLNRAWGIALLLYYAAFVALQWGQSGGAGAG